MSEHTQHLRSQLQMLCKPVGAWIKQRLKWVLGSVVLCVPLTCTGVWLYYSYINSVEYALKKLNQAIAMNDMPALAELVDFRTLASDSAMRILSLLPPSPVSDSGPAQPQTPRTNADQVAEIEKHVQQALIQAFTQRTKATNAPKAEPKPEQVENQGPLYAEVQELKQREIHAQQEAAREKDPDAVELPPVLPANLLEQLQHAPFELVTKIDDLAVVATQIKHPKANMAVTLRLEARKEPVGWRFVRLPDISNIARAYLEEYTAALARREVLHAVRNSEIRHVMYKHFMITECTASKGLTRPNGTVQLILKVSGSNEGEQAVAGVSLTCALVDAHDQNVLTQSFGITRTIEPKETFEIHWNYEYTADTPIAIALSGQAPVMCLPEVKSVTLANGKLLYLRPTDKLFKE